MGYGAYLRALMEPMGVYRFDQTAVGAETEAVGVALDTCGGGLEELEHEMTVATATGWGLEAVECLLARRPATEDLERRRAALAALLRIGGDSFTLTAINDNLKGCGLNAVAAESRVPGRVEVRFPQVPGIPDRVEEMQKIIEDILPCHLGVDYVYWYVNWAMLEERFASWGALEAMGLSWGRLEKLVQ